MTSQQLPMMMLVLFGGAFMAQHALAGTTCPFMTGVDPIERELGELKLKFVGVKPTVTRGVADKPKIVITKYSHEPMIEEKDGALVVTAGSCGGAKGADSSTSPAPADDADGKDADQAPPRGAPAVWLLGAMAAGLGARGSPVAGVGAGLSAFAAATLGRALVQEVRRLDAHGEATNGACDAAMEVEVHAPAKEMTMADVDDAVSKIMKVGQYNTCPAESTYVENHPTVYKGYKGCAGDTGLIPCGQDGFGGMSAQGAGEAPSKMSKPFEFDEASGTCKDTGRTMKDEILWILWGLPMDTHELVKRTGTNQVVHFPLSRGSYPSHAWSDHGDEGLDAKAVDRDWLMYIDAFTKSELDQFETTLTEGAEQGMGMIYASMMIHIARTSCNRAIHLLVESPTYGYDMGSAVAMANKEAGSFYNSSECSCFATDTCKTGTITLKRHGWFPGTPFPQVAGDDGQMYDVSSEADTSPWFERMVWPENPTGETRTQQGPAKRLVCDGCYVAPPYFPDGKIPGSKKPKCSAWAFSLTKTWSATIRTGTAMTLKDHPISAAMSDVASEAHSIHNGIYSEWTWKGGIQVKQMMMSKPYTDPTSWIGAYTILMKEKWDLIIDAFKDCPIWELTNGPLEGAYGWLKKKGEYRGLNSGWLDSSFLDVLGIHTTSYNFGFRGATASDYYGEGYGNADFTRLQLYRDISVYQEVARRVKIACAGDAVEHSGGKYMTIAEWKASKEAGRRRLAENGGVHPATAEERARHLQEAVPRLTDTEARILAEQQHEAHQIEENIEKHCAPREYSTSCLMRYSGYVRPDVSIRRQ